jgi:hypothetical protein
MQRTPSWRIATPWVHLLQEMVRRLHALSELAAQGKNRALECSSIRNPLIRSGRSSNREVLNAAQKNVKGYPLTTHCSCSVAWVPSDSLPRHYRRTMPCSVSGVIVQLSLDDRSSKFNSKMRLTPNRQTEGYRLRIKHQ